MYVMIFRKYLSGGKAGKQEKRYRYQAGNRLDAMQ